MENINYRYKRIPVSRIATFDILSVEILKHHVSALLEFDVTDARRKIHELRKDGTRISFNGWLIKVIGKVLEMNPEASAYLFSKKKLIIFNDINISFLVEKKESDNKVPIPLVITQVNKKSAIEITTEIENAKALTFNSKDIVLNKKTSLFEKIYYNLPGFLRRFIWRLMLSNPKIAYKNMGNAVITSLGMMGRINGWFVHKSVHPVSFGIGSVLKKPVVYCNEIKIREILNMTILADHDVTDGAQMVRFLNDLTKFIEAGEFIYEAKTD